ncbi:fimbria/pilus periplasmic chaperone [Providencia rettgeri]
MDGIIKITGFATLLFFSVQACASLVLQGTRIIFPSDKKAVGIQLTNYSEQATLTQSWVDEGNLDSTPETTNAPFIVTPPLLKSRQMTELNYKYALLATNSLRIKSLYFI